MSTTGVAPWKAQKPTWWVHMNKENIKAELVSMERELAVRGCEGGLERMKESLRDKPYYMAEETEKVLEGLHGIEDCVMVATSHAECYILRRLPDLRGESREYVSGGLRAWALDIPVFTDTEWELAESIEPGCIPDFRPRQRYLFDNEAMLSWLAGLPFRRAYTRNLPGRWVTVAKYLGLTIDPGFYEGYIHFGDFESNIKPLYLRDTDRRVGPDGCFTGIESVAEAFGLAAELRQRMHAADVLCDPTVHIPGFTDCGESRPSVRNTPWPGNRPAGDYKRRAGEVFAKAHEFRSHG